jgi:predicted HicB family RNase H-like nuclease
MSNMNQDDMRPEYDFSKGERGKFYRPGTMLRLPVYLTPELHAQLSATAERKGLSLSDLVNDILTKELAIAEALR